MVWTNEREARGGGDGGEKKKNSYYTRWDIEVRA